MEDDDRRALLPKEERPDDNKEYMAGCSSSEEEEHDVVLGERPDYYVRKSRRAFWLRCILFTLACMVVTFAVYLIASFLKHGRHLPEKVLEEKTPLVSHTIEKNAHSDEGKVAERLEKIYHDMLGDSRPYALTYLSSDFRRVMIDVFKAERECECTILDHDLWTRTTGTDFTMQLKSVTMASEDRADAEVTVTGRLSHYFNQVSLVVMLLLEHGQWYVDDMLSSSGSEKNILRQQAEEVLSTLSRQEGERQEEVRHEAPMHTLRMRGAIDEWNDVDFDMYLTISEGNVTGEYDQVNGDGARFVLTGQLDEDGVMVLREYKNGIASGHFFEGRLEGNAFKGKYKNSLGTMEYDFNASLQ